MRPKNPSKVICVTTCCCDAVTPFHFIIISTKLWRCLTHLRSCNLFKEKISQKSESDYKRKRWSEALVEKSSKKEKVISLQFIFLVSSSVCYKIHIKKSVCWLIWAQIEWIVGRKCVCKIYADKNELKSLHDFWHVVFTSRYATPLERDLCYFVTQLQNSIFFFETILFYRSVCVVVVEKGTCSCHSRMRKKSQWFSSSFTRLKLRRKAFWRKKKHPDDDGWIWDDEENTITKSPKVLSCYRCCMGAACCYTLFFFVFSSWNRSIKHALQSLRWEWKSSCEISLHFFTSCGIRHVLLFAVLLHNRNHNHISPLNFLLLSLLFPLYSSFFFFTTQQRIPLFLGEKFYIFPTAQQTPF